MLGHRQGFIERKISANRSSEAASAWRNSQIWGKEYRLGGGGGNFNVIIIIIIIIILFYYYFTLQIYPIYFILFKNFIRVASFFLLSFFFILLWFIFLRRFY